MTAEKKEIPWISAMIRMAHKRTFLKIFEQNDYNIELKKSLDLMFNQNRRRCIINLAHFYHHREGMDLARRLLQTPSEYTQPLCDAVKDIARSMNANCQVSEGGGTDFGWSRGPLRFEEGNPEGSLICLYRFDGLRGGHCH